MNIIVVNNCKKKQVYSKNKINIIFLIRVTIASMRFLDQIQIFIQNLLVLSS